MPEPYFTKDQQAAISDACKHARESAENALASYRSIPKARRNDMVLNSITYWQNVRSAAKWIESTSKRRKKGSRRDAIRSARQDQGSIDAGSPAPSG